TETPSVSQAGPESERAAGTNGRDAVDRRHGKQYDEHHVGERRRGSAAGCAGRLWGRDLAAGRGRSAERAGGQQYGFGPGRGADDLSAAELRTGSGGLMITSEGHTLPLHDAATLGGPALTMTKDSHVVTADKMFAAGDVRANENVELTSLPTLFVREHNFWAAKIAAANPALTDEQVYQQARSIVIGEIESITYNQWLPAVLGPGAVKAYRGYDA